MIQVNYNLSKELEFEIMNVSARFELIEFDEDDNEKISPIGKSRMYLFNPYSFNEWIDMVLEADEISRDLYKVLEELENYYEKGVVTGLVLVIGGFEINEEIREQGYGSKFLRKILDDFFFMNIEIVGLIPGYYGESSEEYSERNKWIQNFYQKCGFKIINLGESIPVMAKDLHLNRMS